MDRKHVPDIIIDRAVDLWCRALHQPTFDNGDRSLTGFLGMGLAGMLADTEIKKVSDWAATIEKFRHELSTKLKFLRDNEGRPRPAEDIERDKAAGERWVADTYYCHHILSVDYHPGRELAAAADRAGVPHGAFSIKSSVHFEAEYVIAHFGYGAPAIYHYPLPDGRWLLTQLSGADMPKVIEYVLGGAPTFDIEGAP
jgi:hypothetical protein